MGLEKNIDYKLFQEDFSGPGVLQCQFIQSLVWFCFVDFFFPPSPGKWTL